MMNQTKTLPILGERLFGFTVAERGRIPELLADTVLLEHKKSGARLLYLANSDDELGFNIIYRTPCKDETDANHVLEHAVAAASRKYPGKDVFFDMANKSYQTFLNAYTYPVMTCYPVCSRSEEQLRRLMDVTLSCLTDPEVLRTPEIFQREGIRFELTEPESSICLAGTVYSEDYGDLTDTSAEAQSNMLHCLYPGLGAGNSIGRAHRNLWDLTYESVLQVYQDYYTFDNALIVLYGAMELTEMLCFLDREYLDGARRGSGRVFEELQEPRIDGHMSQVFESPAFMDDVSEDSSVLEYAIDISEYSLEEQLQAAFLMEVLNHESSCFHRKLREAGIGNQAYCDYSDEYAKNYVLFGMEDGEEEQGQVFLEVIRSALAEVAEEGVSAELLEAIFMQRQLADSLMRERTALGADVSARIGLHWAVTGELNYFAQRDAVEEEIRRDKEQKILKVHGARFAKPRRSAFVITVPAPGTAEELEEQRERLLAEKKAAMTSQEIQGLVKQTLDFQRWNGQMGRRNSFAIGPEGLPLPENPLEVVQQQIHGIEVYTATAQQKEAGCYRLLLSTDRLQPEELYYLTLYTMLLLELPTARKTAAEARVLETRYLNQLSMGFSYPDQRAGEGHHPMLSVKWLGLTKDFEAALDLVLELLMETRFKNVHEIRGAVEKYLPSYDLSRGGDSLDTAEELAFGYVDSYQLYSNYMEGQGYYDFLSQLADRLEEEESFGMELCGILQSVAERAVSKTRCRIMIAAAEEPLPALRLAAANRLAQLPGVPAAESDYSGCIRRPEARTGICVEAPDQCSVWVTSFTADKRLDGGLQGRDLPFLMAAADQYLMPRLRFEGGAYDAGAGFRLSLGRVWMYTGNDPNTEKTLRIFDGVWDFLRKMTLTQEELSGYIVSAYAAATRPKGSLARAMDAMSLHLEGVDVNHLLEQKKDILRASLADRHRAVERLEAVFRQGCRITMGNEANIRQAEDCFDAVESYKADPGEDALQEGEEL